MALMPVKGLVLPFCLFTFSIILLTVAICSYTNYYCRLRQPKNIPLTVKEDLGVVSAYLIQL